MLTIKKIKEAKFANAAGTITRVANGYAFYEEGKGWIAFSHDRDRFGILIPYIPCGGRKALQAILDAGGFVTMDGMEYVNPNA